MADDTYHIDQIATNGATVTVTDDGTGDDWLVLDGTYVTQSDIRLAWTTNAGSATSASGLYWGLPGQGSRLVVNGVIENVRGGNGADFIQGNELANILYGDSTRDGAGDDDVLWGGDGADTIYGGAGNDELRGDNGDDLLFGGADDDDISGGAGIDVIEGGEGGDTLSGGSDVGDVVSYRGSDAAVTVALTFGSTTTGIGGDAEGDQIYGFTDIRGSDFADRLTDTVAGAVAFGGNANTFYGFGGRDTLRLGGGDDTGYGGDDVDVIWGEAGNDRAWGEAGNDTLNLGTGNDVGHGGVGRDVLRGEDGNDRLFGDGDDDILFTGAGNDVAHGGAGNDQILTTGDGRNLVYGDAGDDALIAAGGINVMRGGAGSDRFEFRVSAANLAEGGHTEIVDMQRGRGEQIDLRVFGALDFVGTASFSGQGGEVRYHRVAGGVEVLVDSDGDSAADLGILVDGLDRLTGHDFLLG